MTEYEETEIGLQALVPGVKPIGDTDRLAQKAKAPLQSRKQQKPCDVGLFDDAGRAQIDLEDLL